MGSKFKPKIKKELFLGLLILILIAGVAFFAYQAGKSNAEEKYTRTVGNQNQDGEGNPEQIPEVNKPGLMVFEDYKKQIQENKLTGIEKTTLYINAAFAGSFVEAPESSEYAKEALNIMPAEMRNAANNKELISKLQLIAAGKFEEVNKSR